MYSEDLVMYVVILIEDYMFFDVYLFELSMIINVYY